MSYIKLEANSSTEVLVRQPDNSLSKSAVWVERDNFYCADDQKADKELFGLFSVDTEFENGDDPVTDEDIRKGRATNTTLSYQFCCRIYDKRKAAVVEWSGICFPEDGQRLRLSDILIYALHEGLSQGLFTKAPLSWYFVAHFTRADLPAFADFKTINQLVTAVRGTFISVGNSIPLLVDFGDKKPPLKISFKMRDTILLLPEGSKSLKAMGDMIGFPKIELDPDPVVDRALKSQMRKVMDSDPELFDRYAINDAIVAARYADIVMQRSKDTIGKFALPVTLTGNAVDLLQKMWADEKLNYLDIMGKEVIKTKIWDRKLQRYRHVAQEVFIDVIDVYMGMVTEAYHGGRGEQYWFGPSYEADWTDYDLSGAYPTAMGLIRTADWVNAKPLIDLKGLDLDSLGAICVDFEFPAHVRFPTLPVRTANGLIFPLTGRSTCAAPEIILAQNLGAKLRLVYGVLVPYKDDKSIFGDFIKYCITKRYQATPKSVDAKFWKEYSNATYGKTAQGLREKRAYDNREDVTKPLPPSAITNAFFASFITSFVRAALGEILNSLPDTVCVFSCTTDGFLTDATQAEIDAASGGPICSMFAASRENLTGKPTVLEIKHKVRRLVGWRTRGQATLIPGNSATDPDSNIVLAKGGIWTTIDRDTVELQNEYIIDTFLSRTAESTIRVISKTGIRDIVRYGADLVEKVRSKRLNMEYDWKRRPASTSEAADLGHLCFSTQPWESVAQFNTVRDQWEAYVKTGSKPQKTIADFRAFATVLLTQTILLNSDSKYLSKENPDLKRLRQRLTSAWRHSAAGLVWKDQSVSATGFATILTDCGLACTRADVENGARKSFIAKTTPPTPAVLEVLNILKVHFPALMVDELVADATKSGAINLLPTLSAPDRFIRKAAAKGNLSTTCKLGEAGSRSPISRPTAYHEAGHAVAAYLCGVHIDSIYVVPRGQAAAPAPDGVSGGVAGGMVSALCVANPEIVMEELKVHPYRRNDLWEAACVPIFVLGAGAAAEARYSHRRLLDMWCSVCANEDYAGAFNALVPFTSDDDVAIDKIEEMWSGCAGQFRQYDVWNAVKALAEHIVNVGGYVDGLAVTNIIGTHLSGLNIMHFSFQFYTMPRRVMSPRARVC
jgi:hypothetical protein